MKQDGQMFPYAAAVTAEQSQYIAILSWLISILGHV